LAGQFQKLQNLALQVILAIGLGGVGGSDAIVNRAPQVKQPPVLPPKPAEVYGPKIDFDRLPLSNDWATRKKIKQHRAENTTSDPLIIARNKLPDGTVRDRFYEGKPGKMRDIASVGKVVSIVMLDDLIKKKVISLEEPLNPVDLEEFGLNQGLTYRDAITAAYVVSDNGAAQVAVKSAVRKDMKLSADEPVTNAAVGEYMSRYLIREGMSQSVLVNGAGYPVNADEYRELFSDPKWPERFNNFDGGELTGFLERKFCVNGLTPQVGNILNLKNGPPKNYHPVGGIAPTVLLPSGFAQQSNETMKSPGTVFVAAKTGTSDVTQSGLIITKQNNGACQVVVGIGNIPNRTATIPDIAQKNQKKPVPAPAPNRKI
jgi:hypothetical protein